jgi:hypothetical protein
MILHWFSELLRFAFPPRLELPQMRPTHVDGRKILWPDEQAREHEKAIKIAESWQKKWGPRTRWGQK